jgi:rod shape-determining protein MreC
VAGVLVLLSLVLITVYFREPAGGGLHGVQSAGATVLKPFEVASERIAQPFQDAYNWLSGLIHAKSENAKLRAQVDELTQQVIQNTNAAQENADLRRQLHFIGLPRFPQDYNPVATEVISRSPSEFNQQVAIAAGSGSGIRVNDPVVTADGLVGLVTEVASGQSQVTLLTDPNLKVSATDLQTQANGIVGHGQGAGTLTFDRVQKSQLLRAGDAVVTQGWHLGKLSSLYPAGIPIGTITGASNNEVDFYWQAQVSPRVHFDSLHTVLVLVPKTRIRR